MCPLRFILVFFSAVLAGYFAWRSFRSPSLGDDGDVAGMTPSKVMDSAGKTNKGEDEEGKSIKRMARDGFWVFVDMASGRYLWRNFKQMRKQDDETDNRKSS